MKLGIIEKPLKILYSYPAIVIGMILCASAVYDPVCIFQCRKTGLVTGGSCQRSGASKCKAFWTVTFKLTLPGLLSGVILTFIPSMGLFFIADILGGNKIVLVGSLIQDQMTRGNNWPFAAALAVVLMILTTLMIMIVPEGYKCERTGGNRMKKNSKLSGFYLGLIFFLMYLPIGVVVVFSFNESKTSGAIYRIFPEMVSGTVSMTEHAGSTGKQSDPGVLSCLVSAVIGTLGAVDLSRIHWKTKGALEYISICR